MAGGRPVVVMDGQKLAEVLRGPNGPVARRLIEDGEFVKLRARQRVGVYRAPDAYSAQHRKRKPGQLRDSIIKRVVARASRTIGFSVEVGSEDEIALLHHEGTEAHDIKPRAVPLTKAGAPKKRFRPDEVRPYLVFFWGRVGHVVRLRQVHHPGTQPNRYLTDSLTDLRSRY